MRCSTQKKRAQKVAYAAGRLRPGYPFTSKRRGWPSSKRPGFHAVCVKCDGYANTFGYSRYGEYGVVRCPVCDGQGYSKKIYQPQFYTRRKSK
jgi:hypothetical protein